MPFRDIVGHRPLIALLSRSVGRRSLPPSLIFAGPDGVGKRLVAMATAQALNCLAPVSIAVGETTGVDACGTCTACARIARRVHPDILVIEPEDGRSIRIEAVREAIDRAAYRPFEGRRRLVIIDEADTLVIPAQNALLKSLEEPPPSSSFVLITSRPDMLLPTVRSRCPRLRFGPLQPGDMSRVLVARGASEVDALALAAMADGSMARALEASAGEIVRSREVAQRALEEVIAAGAPGRRLDAAKGLLAKEGAGTDRAQLATNLRAMTSLLRDAVLVSVRGDAVEIANADMRPSIQRLAQSFPGARGIRAFEAVRRALDAIDRNVSVKTVADWLVLQL